jgi:hypothetical protein
MDNKTPNINESILLGKLLNLMSKSATLSLEKFSAWLLAGFGVAFTLILTNIESISKFVTIENIKFGVILYLCALGAGVLQRWLGSMVQAGTMASEESDGLGANAPEGIDFNNILKSVEDVTFYPQKWLIKWQFSKLRDGDYAVSGKLFARITQIQGTLVLIQATLVITSILVIINGFSA